jgi:hypothetical protein
MAPTMPPDCRSNSRHEVCVAWATFRLSSEHDGHCERATRKLLAEHISIDLYYGHAGIRLSCTGRPYAPSRIRAPVPARNERIGAQVRLSSLAARHFATSDERREGRYIYYRSDPQGLALLADWVQRHRELWPARIEKLKRVLKELEP